MGGSWPWAGRAGAGRRGRHLSPLTCPSLSPTFGLLWHSSWAVSVTWCPGQGCALATPACQGHSDQCCHLGTSSPACPGCWAFGPGLSALGALVSPPARLGIHAHLVQAGSVGSGVRGWGPQWEGPRQAAVPSSAQAPPSDTTSSGSGQPARAWSTRRGTPPTWTSSSTSPALATPWPSRAPAPSWPAPPAPPARPPLSAGIFQ